MTSLHSVPLTMLDGRETTFGEFAGRAVLVVNVASRCGLTPQYAALETLAETYADRGLTVLGAPCNQFLGQEPGTQRGDRRVLLDDLRRDLPAHRQARGQRRTARTRCSPLLEQAADPDGSHRRRAVELREVARLARGRGRRPLVAADACPTTPRSSPPSRPRSLRRRTAARLFPPPMWRTERRCERRSGLRVQARRA